MRVKLSFEMEIDKNCLEHLKLKHHIDYLIDINDFPEIKSIYNVQIEEIN